MKNSIPLCAHFDILTFGGVFLGVVVSDAAGFTEPLGPGFDAGQSLAVRADIDLADRAEGGDDGQCSEKRCTQEDRQCDRFGHGNHSVVGFRTGPSGFFIQSKAVC